MICHLKYRLCKELRQFNEDKLQTVDHLVGLLLMHQLVVVIVTVNA